ncbi:putative LRR receptor-like serine/threonine-protein kinase At1g51880 [Apium graveolens]|uniref:putative LRR receptor-like serine/threonine-protein kinase At1g51880 n=1 Tax=Apium graveolens TaxID=4045 RepID=UPI003D7A4959
MLNLKGNKFTGPIPAQLLENQKKGILSLSYDVSGDEKKNNKVPAVVVSVVVSVLFLAVIYIGIWIRRRRRKLPDPAVEQSHTQYTYAEVQNITENFKKPLGSGGFSEVFLGNVGNSKVAVKMLSSPDQKAFENEVKILMSINHKNLTSLVGYCNDGEHKGIVYEYMANGSLDQYLSGKNRPDISSWVKRLRIALDAAQGLQYLHDESQKAIIHRDVKPSNILLNKQLQAKLADFGLSKAYPAEGGTHISTVNIAGTPGYIDPDYEDTKRLTEKSDVFSFGVVLLEMITGRLEDRNHTVIQFVTVNFKNGNFIQVVDERFKNKFDANSVWEAIRLALTCVSQTSSSRPTMIMVVNKLKDCLAIETYSHYADPDDSGDKLTTDPEKSLFPKPRRANA